jgi:hypothetical protein
MVQEEASAQLRKPKKSGNYRDPFFDTQWWIGLRLGTNFTKAKPVERYSAYTSTQTTDTDAFDKDYQGFGKGGVLGGLEMTFYFKGICLSFQPDYRRQEFTYKNYYAWGDPANPTNAYEISSTTQNRLDYIHLPLLVRYEPLKGRLRPYIQAGGYYANLMAAYKAYTASTTDHSSGTASTYISEEIISGSRDLYIRSNWGWIAGGGVSYPVGNFRLAADVTYRRNTNNITNVANRYENERYTGAGDIADDIKLRNITVSFALLVPLRYISKNDFNAR